MYNWSSHAIYVLKSSTEVEYWTNIHNWVTRNSKIFSFSLRIAVMCCESINLRHVTYCFMLGKTLWNLPLHFEVKVSTREIRQVFMNKQKIINRSTYEKDKLILFYFIFFPSSRILVWNVKTSYSNSDMLILQGSPVYLCRMCS